MFNKNIVRNIYNQFTLFCQCIKYVSRQFLKDNCFESASALTYTTLLSIVPLLAVSVFVIKGIPFFQDLWAEAQQFIFSHFIPAKGREVQVYLQEFIKNTGQLPIFGSLFLVLSAMILIFTIEQTFNRIWAVKASRGILNTFLLYWAILTLFPILIGLSFGISSYIWSLPFWKESAEQLGVLSLILQIIPFLLVWLCFTLMYILIPNCYVNPCHAFRGAFLVAIAFEISKRLFASYVASINLNALLYGAFATIPLFLLWVYISWFIILFGAVLVNAMSYHNYNAQELSEHRFLQCYKWLFTLWSAQQQGNALSVEELFQANNSMIASEPYSQLDTLEKTKWIKKTADSRYVLSRDLSVVGLKEFYQSLPYRLPSMVTLEQYQGLDIQLLKSQIESFEQCFSGSFNQSFANSFSSHKD